MYPKSDSNRHDLRHMFLKHTCLPFHHRGIYHITQAFYFQLREIVSNLTLLTTVRVPEDMICDSERIRTFDPKLRRFVLYPAELPNQFILCFLWAKRESNPYRHSVYNILSVACIPFHHSPIMLQM